jgi:GT2 family glycosyltransferase
VAAGRNSTATGGRTPSVGAVVPCKDEIEGIERCLRALRAQQPPVTSIVVVDNGSTDGSLEVARQLADQVLEVPTGSISALRNAGARALGDVEAIAFVDADTEVGDGWLAAGLAALAAGAALVGSRTSAGPDATWVAEQWAHIEAQQAHAGSLLWTQHLLVDGGLFRSVGGFDERVLTGEDADLSLRVQDAGGRVEMVAGMRAVHHGFPRDLRSFVRRERWHTSHDGWWQRMSRGSRLLVGVGGGWAVLGAAAAAAVPAGRPRPLAVWAAASAAAVPALGLVGSRRPRTAPRDGVLLGIWLVTRVLRFPREVRRGLARR